MRTMKRIRDGLFLAMFASLGWVADYWWITATLFALAFSVGMWVAIREDSDE